MAKRKKRKVPKTGPVLQMSGLEVTRLRKPRYNGFACGTGIHGDVKYNRAKAKQEWRRSSQGELPFYAVMPVPCHVPCFFPRQR